jgi:hypothetical protein
MELGELGFIFILLFFFISSVIPILILIIILQINKRLNILVKIMENNNFKIVK